MPDIVLSTLNARYIHPAFGLRYLMANLGELKDRAVLLEFDIKRTPAEAADVLLAQDPRVVGLGVYVWNAMPVTALVRALKRARPDLIVVLGGPEVSFEDDAPEICGLADYVVAGEADLTFANLCRRLLAGERPAQKFIPSDPPDVNRLALPYDLYTEDDLAHRMVYVESSRGCPFECEYCVSCHDAGVRYFDLPPLFAALGRLIDRGARGFKFVDRTFNVNIPHALAVMEFLRPLLRPGMQVHFEMVPDRFPAELLDAIRRFPPGALRLEIGIQSFDPEVNRRVRRRQDERAIDANLQALREAGAVIHADLIAGLPGESREGFAAGFDRLVRLGPAEIQVGVLKRLRGAPIGRHDAEWGMAYSAEPPYEILENRLMDRATMDRIKRFARFWETIGNSGDFGRTLPLLFRDEPFEHFMRLSDWLYARLGRDHSIALREMVERVFEYAMRELKLDRRTVTAALRQDYEQGGKRTDVPAVLTEALEGRRRRRPSKTARGDAGPP